jgi:hypothetical protein
MTTIDPEFGGRFRARWLRDVQNAHQRGFAEGRATGKVGAVLDIIRARRLALSEEQLRRISSCRDLDEVSDWLGRAATARSVDDVIVAREWEFQSDVVKRWDRKVKDARMQGQSEGNAIGRAEAILEVLKARGLGLSEEQRQRIASCRDLDRLSAWLERAVGAASAECLFR